MTLLKNIVQVLGVQMSSDEFPFVRWMMMLLMMGMLAWNGKAKTLWWLFTYFQFYIIDSTCPFVGKM